MHTLKKAFAPLSIFLALASSPLAAIGADQSKCNMPLTVRSGLSTEEGYVEKQKSNAVGTALKKGGVLFYVAMAEANRYYTTQQEITITDPSPISPNFEIVPDKKYPVIGSLKLDNQSRDQFLLVNISSGMLKKAIIPVRPDGFACSALFGVISGQLQQMGFPTTHQDEPLKLGAEEVTGGKKKSLSIVVKELDEATATLELTGMLNGTALKKRSMTVDLFAGRIEIAGLSMELKKTSNEIKVVSVIEPTDYGVWMRQALGL